MHRHVRRGVQRRMVAGAQARGVGAGVHQRVGVRPHPAAAAGLGTRAARRDLRHEHRLQPGGHPEPAHDRVHGCAGGRLRPARGDPGHAPPRLPAVRRHRHPRPRDQQRHPLHDARLPARRDRAHRPLSDGRTRTAHHRQAQPDAAGQGAGARHPAPQPGLRRDPDPGQRVRARPEVPEGAGADPHVAGGGPHARRGVRRQAEQHAGDAQPQGVDAWRRDVYVGPRTLPRHDEPVCEAGARIRRPGGRQRPASVLFRGRGCAERLDDPVVRRAARHRVHGSAQAGRLCAARPVAGEPRGGHDRGRRGQPGGVQPQPAGERGRGRGRRAGRPPLQEGGLPLRPAEDRRRPELLRLRGRAVHRALRRLPGRA
ncbi:MAG: hypothetical protein BWY52_02767 [Chloroflexi bacterium ADurb.Bin325]|nr:MAG: hypothetical protein BWY52_02767 [Chloroflexi bacterium ADurb.Bin325]